MFVINKLSEHFTPAPSKRIVKRFKFQTRFHKSGESVTAELCSLAKSYNIGGTIWHKTSTFNGFTVSRRIVKLKSINQMKIYSISL